MSAIIKKGVMFDVMSVMRQPGDMAYNNTVLKESKGDSSNRGVHEHKAPYDGDKDVDWMIDEDSPSSNQSARLQRMVDALSAELHGVAHEQKYLLARDIVHLRLSENTKALVVRWAVFECLIIVIGSVFQIYYITRFFEVRRIL